MTTAVKIDAHAGWPVLVTTLVGESNGPHSVETHLVEANTERTFYIHSGVRVISILEQPAVPKEA